MTTKPKNQSIGVVKWTRPSIHRKKPIEYFYACRNGDDHRHEAEKCVHIAPAPIVKKWCSQTTKERKAIATIAQTIET